MAKRKERLDEQLQQKRLEAWHKWKLEYDMCQLDGSPLMDFDGLFHHAFISGFNAALRIINKKEATHGKA